ncbi:hypothetical protein [Natrinema versiforme]|uniref:Uncharacterized protein n=1 Tax=Natrinema versiforme TaxID=88724 RepID=A0A4P8WHK0_9EURY|nr:hypothetical protein [Natrinema versiforme]QCS42522.1 hypothetical protein FEJ81_09175 [Natrinema versiforme]
MSSYSLGSVLILLGFAILVGPFIVLFFLTIGPAGWVLLGGSLIVVGALVSLWENARSDGSDRRTWTNCDNCGRCIYDGSHACTHCGTDR